MSNDIHNEHECSSATEPIMPTVSHLGDETEHAAPTMPLQTPQDKAPVVPVCTPAPGVQPVAADAVTPVARAASEQPVAPATGQPAAPVTGATPHAAVAAPSAPAGATPHVAAAPAPAPVPPAAPAATSAMPVPPQMSTSASHAHKPTSARARKLEHIACALLIVVIVIAAAVFGFNQIKSYVSQYDTSAASQNEQQQSSAGPGQPIDVTTAREAAKKALPSVVSIGVAKQDASGVGSGVLLDKDGNILTNYHVIEGAQKVSVTIGNKTYPAQVVGSDPSSDLAVVKADLKGAQVTPIKTADSDKLQVGDWVMSVGSPYGLNQSVSAGIVSSLARNQSLTTKGGATTLYTNLIQTDASINPGNSGGALVNSSGELVGICTLFSSTSGAFSGIGFAIPSNYATSVAQKIIKGEKVTHAYIGLSMQTINPQNAEHYRLPVSAGAFVADVAQGGPAEKAGIQRGDIITKVNDKAITSADSMLLEVRSHEIGQTIAVTVKRGEEEKTFNVTLSSDEQLQELQKKMQQQRMQQQQGNPLGAPDGNGGMNKQELIQKLKEYLQELN